MKVDLEVLASTSIKRRKPWPQIIWVGEEQESILLLDACSHRASVLYVPSGKTKRKLPKLSPVIDQIQHFSHTNNGRYLLGLLQSGDVFVWHKDNDVMKIIPGLQSQTDLFSKEKCYITASDNVSHVLVAMGTGLFYVWEMDKGDSMSRGRESHLRGLWHRVAVPEGMELPPSDTAECCLAGRFYTSQVFGSCCQLSIVYNRGSMLSISTLLLRFPDAAEAFGKNLPIFSAEWSLLEYPFQQMHPNFEAISTQGAYITSYSGNGQVLAIAANQRQPSQSAMLFVSPLTDTVLVASMKGCGVADPNKTGRHYWVADIAWTYDGLFLTCILKNGSVCIVPRLGEPIIIQTDGCNVNMGPSRYLPLHPAICVGDPQGGIEPSAAEQDPMQQKFSLATHPSLPILLFSDGFLVTVLQLPVEMTCVTLMREMVLESAKYLKKVYRQEDLDMTVADAYKLSKGKKSTPKGSGEQRKLNKAYEFELAEISLNSTHDSEVSMVETTNQFGFDPFGAIGNMDAGKIVFGEPEMISANPNATFSGLDASEALLRYLEESMSILISTWKLSVSYPDMWTAEVDNIAKQTIHNLTKIFSIVLDCPAVDAIIPILTPRQNSAVQNPRVYNIIVVYRNILQLLRFDTYNQHLIPTTLRLVHKTITLMLSSKELENTDPRLKTLFGCYSILKHAETSLNRTYVWVPSSSQTGTPEGEAIQQRFEPAVMVRVERQSSPPGGTASLQGVQLNQHGQLPGRRLAGSWKLLYKHLLQYEARLGETGDRPGELPHVQKLMASVRLTLHDSDTEVTPRRASSKLSIGDKLSVDGEHTQAIEAWKDQLKILAAASKSDTPKTARMLHSVLYTHLLKGELGAAVDFIDNLILQASVNTAVSSAEFPAFEDGSRPPLMTLVSHRSQDSEEEELVPCIKNKSIRQTVQTMARYMAAYFSNTTMYIFPPHSAQPLPSVHMSSVPTKSRIIPQYHEDVSNMIRKDELSGVWTTERVVEYLLLSGLVCETAWFAAKMGDWKTAFLLSVAHDSHKEIAQHLYAKPKKPLQMPDHLAPESVLQDKLGVLVKSDRADSTPAGNAKHQKQYYLPINDETNIPQLTRTVQEILSAGIMCQVQLAPWLLTRLLDQLRGVTSRFTALVPQDFYLPAPPLYCPQPAEEELTRDNPDVEYEKQLRIEISSLIQLTLVVFNSANLSLPVARWYIQELFKVQERAAQFKATTEGPCLELPEILQQYKIFRSAIVDHKDDPHVHQVLVAFRDFCTILWLLHVRDELSLQLRKRGTQLSNEKNADNKASPQSTLSQDWVQECFTILKWAVHMLAFSRYIADDGSIYKVILSLILELPATEDTADILAEHFCDSDTLDAEVQEKLERLLASWQSIDIVPEDDGKSARVEDGAEEEEKNGEEDEDDGSVRKSVTFYQASPRAKTLSVYYHKQCDVVPKVVKKKRKSFGHYDEFVFSPQENETTFPSGSQLSGLIFIGSRPFESKKLYVEFLDRFYAICFTKVVEQESEQGRNPRHAILMPFSKQIREAEFQTFWTKHEETYQKRPSSVVLASPRAKFFRSQSESQVQDLSYPASSPNQKPRGLFRSSSSGDVLQSPGSHGNHGMFRVESDGSLPKGSPGKGNRPPASPSRGKPNMTGMASRFFHSEEVLYRDPEDSQDVHWILDVNFGQRYLALQQLLDWLHHWGSKQHTLGLHGKGDLGLKPTMRIEVPTQLVILALWLLEHKYSKTKKKPKTTETENTPIDDVLVEENAQVQVRPKPKALATVEELTENDSFTQVSQPPPRSRSHSPYGGRPRSVSPHVGRPRSVSPQPPRPRSVTPSGDRTLESMRSFTSTQEETDMIQSAYKKVLNGFSGDESSSLEVSSLEPDEYEDDLKQTLSAIGSERLGRSKKSAKNRSGSQRTETSPDTKYNSSLNHAMKFATSPERANNSYSPQTSTPVRNSPSKRNNRPEIHGDISHISLPPSGNTAPPGGYHENHSAPPSSNHNNNTAPPGEYRGRLLGGNPALSAPAARNEDPVVAPSNPPDLAGMDLAQQLQFIVRGELRRMMEVQHRSMMAMMGAMDGMPPQPMEAWQPGIPANQGQAPPPSQSQPMSSQTGEVTEQTSRSPKGKKSTRGVLGELKNLQTDEVTQRRRRKSKSPSSTLRQGKENVDGSPLRMSALRGPHDSRQEVELYRVEGQEGAPNVNLYPRFLRVAAEKDTNPPVRFPTIPGHGVPQEPSRQSEGSQDVSMPLLHVERTVPGQVFPKGQRQQVLPHHVTQPGYFQPPQFSNPPGHQSSPAPPPVPHQGSAESLDSGIGIPLLRFATNEPGGRHPRFGELLPPGVVIESDKEQQQKKMLQEKYAREFHKLHGEKMEELDKQRFGELLHLEAERRGRQPKPRSPRKSPRKAADSVSEISSKVSSKKERSKKEATPRAKSPSEAEEEAGKSHDREEPMKFEGSGEKAESADEAESEDATEAETMEESETNSEEIHDGYAFRPGEFEAYLALEKQLATTKDTHARIQLKTALKLQQQRIRENWRRPKVDFATMTQEYADAHTEADPAIEMENIRRADKYTSITKDTGVDPIHEAVIEYNKSRQPHVMPPDIYMGLRFADAEHGQRQAGQGRTYLNVVDLDASAILRDLHEKPEPVEPALDVSLPATHQHLQHRIAEEERVAHEPPVIQRPSRADELTVKMFDIKAHGIDTTSIAIVPRESMPESKYAIISRLRDMNTQMAAIDRMSNNMEREFKSTRLALHTLEHMTEAMEPPTHDQEEWIGEADPGVRTSQESPRKLTPVPSERSPTRSARETARSKKSVVITSVEDKKILSVELSKMSGLSGISDIIGDMVARGEIDLDDAGLTEQEAERLVKRGAIRQEEIEVARVGLDDIKKMAELARGRNRDQQELRSWMAAKQAKQMYKYRQQLDELREREVHPFKPAPDSFDQNLSMQERKALAEVRDDSRKMTTRAFMTKRLDEAQHLLGSILTDRPAIPQEPPPRLTPKRKPARDKSPAEKKGRGSPVRTPGVQKARDYSPPTVRSIQQRQERYRDVQDAMYDHPAALPSPAREPSPPPKVHMVAVRPREEVAVRGPARKHPGIPRLRLTASLDDLEEEPRFQQTAETTGDLAAYTQAVEDMEVSESQEPAPTPGKTFKVKPFNQLVRLQRPERTRKKADKFVGDYTGRQQTVSVSESVRTDRTELTQREKELIYGSKRMPGKKPTETVPRRVKTYTERLQEMKSPGMPFATPVAPRSHFGSSIASASARPSSRPVKPRHKPVTYVEQLQKLNAGTHKPRATGPPTALQRTVVKSRRLPHKPKTYAQQLQELQPPRTLTGPPSKRTYKPSPTRVGDRQRPYKDPYAREDYDQWERESVVSAWSMGEDVRGILYEDADSSIAVGQSASYAPSEQMSDYYMDVMGQDYAASVDISDLVRIADAGSVSSGSVMSVIDWDQVDDLIGDV